jgi:hypothetical protein
MTRSVRVWGIALLAVIGLASCDGSEQVAGPATRLHAQYDFVDGTDGRQYKLVEGQIKVKKLSASAWIGRKGGYVFLEGDTLNGRQTMHVLYVPEGAVSKSTLFTVSIASPHFIKVDLRAQVEVKYRGEVSLVDVGDKGFREPVLLALDHSLVSPEIARDRLKVLYDPEDGKPFQPMPSQIIPGYEQWVIAQLDHFSKYAVAMD